MMVKRRRVAEAIEYEEDQQYSIDRISMLPDELLVSILSFFTFKEAATTSILSHQWRNLWTLVPDLDFDGKNSFIKVLLSGNEWKLVFKRERGNYVRWVNRVIALRKSLRPSSTIESFRVNFNLNMMCKKYIDRWIRYALAGKVRRLQVELTKEAGGGGGVYNDYYTFPYKYLYVCNSIHFKYLQKITLKYVNVNDEAVEFFLCNCPLLEDLCLANCRELLNIKIIGPHPSLKRLEINWCEELYSVQIRDVNLVCFKCIIGSKVRLRLKNVPHLIEVSVDATYARQMRYLLLRLSNILPQLEKFNIHFPVDLYYPWTGIKVLWSSVKMSNLKQLVVKVALWGEKSRLLPLTKLISASPCLQSFTLEVSRHEPKYVKRKTGKIVRSYAHLKEVSLCGYRGVTSELELIIHFLENAKALEKIVIDTCNPTFNEYTRSRCPEFMDKVFKEQMDARARAKVQLAKIVPPRINLDIR